MQMSSFLAIKMLPNKASGSRKNFLLVCLMYKTYASVPNDAVAFSNFLQYSCGYSPLPVMTH